MAGWFLRFLAMVALLIPDLGLRRSAALPPLPATSKKPVMDEDPGLRVPCDPPVRQWTEAQNCHSQALWDQSAALETLRKRVQELLNNTWPRYFSLRYTGGVLVALTAQPPKQQPFLITLKSPDEPASAQVALDPNQLSAIRTTTLGFYVSSHDGRLLAVWLSKRGSEEGRGQRLNGYFVVMQYGTVKDVERFRAIYAASPYQLVRERTAYPAAFLRRGANNGRTDPAHSNPGAARIQAATPSNRPVLVQVRSDAGQGMGGGLSQQRERVADGSAFLFQLEAASEEKHP